MRSCTSLVRASKPAVQLATTRTAPALCDQSKMINFEKIIFIFLNL